MPFKKLCLSALIALIVVTVSYGIVFVEDYFFLADFRLWTLAIKAFEAPILRYWPYILLFCTYYIAISVATNCFNFNSIGGKLNGVICALFAAFPALVFPWIQYLQEHEESVYCGYHQRPDRRADHHHQHLHGFRRLTGYH